MRNHGDGQRKRKRKQSVGSRAIVAQIVEDDRELRPRMRTRAAEGSAGARDRAPQLASPRKRCACASRANVKLKRTTPSAEVFRKRKFVPPRDFAERLPQRAHVRSVVQRNGNAVGWALAFRRARHGTKVGANRDVRLVRSHVLRGGRDFAADDVDLRSGERFFGAAREEENDNRGKRGGKSCESVRTRERSGRERNKISRNESRADENLPRGRTPARIFHDGLRGLSRCGRALQNFNRFFHDWIVGGTRRSRRIIRIVGASSSGAGSTGSSGVTPSTGISLLPGVK